MTRERKILILILIFGVVLIGLQVKIKKGLDEESISGMKSHFKAQSMYNYEYAPDFEITYMDGSTFRLSDNIGKNVVVLNFFTTWCEPCVQEMDELQYFYEKMEGKKVIFIAIDVGETIEVVHSLIIELKKTQDVTFPVAVDREKTVAGKYRINSYPTNIVIDPQGRIVMYERGAILNADISLIPLVNANLRMLNYPQKNVMQEYKKNAPQILPEKGNTSMYHDDAGVRSLEEKEEKSKDDNGVNK